MSKYFVPVDIDGNIKPEVHEAFTDNGIHSHFRLLDANTGNLLWTENPEEDTHCWVGPVPYTTYAIPIQSPTTKELIEREAVEMLKQSYSHLFIRGKMIGTIDTLPSSALNDYAKFIKGATFALSLPKQDNGDGRDLILKLQTALSQSVACIISGHKPDIKVIEYYGSLIEIAENHTTQYQRNETDT